jgi:hypothetical protein
VGIILEPTLIQEHIYAFYRELLSASTPRGCGLVPNTWGVSRLVSMEENYQLYLTFIEAELEAIVKDMKPDTAPGPYGFPLLFFKRFWLHVKFGILHILN